MIFTGFEPNMMAEDVMLANAILRQPRTWQGGDGPARVEAELRNFFRVPYAHTVDSGRSALLIALQSLGVGEGDEVLIQAYTCAVVVNPIVALGAKPVYVDIGADLNMDPDDLAKKITSRAKTVIVQHTFGLPAPLKEILAVALDRGLTVIEDCAHSLGATYDGALTGTMGDIGMFSFGSDKVISCVRGGALITSDAEIEKRIRHRVESLPVQSRMKIFRHLLHYPLFSLGKRRYERGGKWLLAFAKKTFFMTRIMNPREKRGKWEDEFPTKLPNALAELLLEQLRRLREITTHRMAIARIYRNGLPAAWKHPTDESLRVHIYLRYTVLVEPKVRDAYMKFCKARGVLLGDWYSTVIAPKDIYMAAMHYVPGSCPRAEDAAKRSINLPTHGGIGEHEAKNIIQLLTQAYENK